MFLLRSWVTLQASATIKLLELPNVIEAVVNLLEKQDISRFLSSINHHILTPIRYNKTQNAFSYNKYNNSILRLIWNQQHHRTVYLCASEECTTPPSLHSSQEFTLTGSQTAFTIDWIPVSQFILYSALSAPPNFYLWALLSKTLRVCITKVQN